AARGQGRHGRGGVPARGGDPARRRGLMPRYRLTIEYDGTPFCGWQRQADRLSVQQALEEAVAQFSGETVSSQAAGRTDAGVHALGQVVHIDIEKAWDPFRIREALNYHLRPHPV